MSRALWSGVTGLNANAFKMDVIGNNIANINTTGYKGSRAQFGDLLSQTISGGTASISGGTAGINPIQVGTGVRILGTDTDFNQGAFITTGNVSDVAISGDGFLMMNNGATTKYTRDGALSVDIDGSLISPTTGYRVQGWQAENGAINTAGPVGDLVIPLGSDTLANETSYITLEGNLNSSSTVDGRGTTAFSATFYNGTTHAAADSSTLLTNLEYDSDSNGTGDASLNLEAGDEITISATKANGTLTARTFTVGTTGTTLGDLAEFMEDAYGIVNDTNADGTEGVTVSGGQIAIQGNIGTANALTDFVISGTEAAGGSLSLNSTAFSGLFQPDALNGFTEASAAAGESSFTQVVVYDSLGVAHTVDAIFARADADENVWSMFITGDDNFFAGSRSTSLLSAAGRVEFTDDGILRSVDGNTATMSLETGAEEMEIEVRIPTITQYGTTSSIQLDTQDGFPPGTLETFTIAASGVITGIYSNGLTQDIGQIALAKFANNDGLIADGDNFYIPGTNAGTPSVGTPNTGGRGTLNSGFLEQSNVDLASEFSDMIITQRAYQANARTITAADGLLAEAINLI